MGGRFNERTPGILVADHTKGEGDAAFLRETNRCGRAAVGYRDHNIGLDGCFFGKFDADIVAGVIDAETALTAIGPREIDVFEHAKSAWFVFKGAKALDTVL